jgi:hypothetical protein
MRPAKHRFGSTIRGRTLNSSTCSSRLTTALPARSAMVTSQVESEARDAIR